MVYSEPIRTIINREFRVGEPKGKKHAIDMEWSVATEPLGQDRDKNRIWSLDRE